MTDVRAHLEPLGLWTSPKVRNRPEAIGSRARTRNSSSESGLVGLTHTIEAEIIPRLVMAHKAAHATSSVPALGSVAPGADEIAALAEQILAEDTNGVNARIDA